MVLLFFASEVAAVCGMNKFVIPTQAIQKVLGRHNIHPNTTLPALPDPPAAILQAAMRVDSTDQRAVSIAAESAAVAETAKYTSMVTEALTTLIDNKDTARIPIPEVRQLVESIQSDDVSSNALNQQLAPIIAQHVAETLTSAAYCAVGKVIEPAARAIRGGKMSDGNQEPMRYCYSSGRKIARIGGRPDAIVRDTNGVITNLTEHKCRMRGLFYSVPVYERVQLHAYMAMIRLRSAELCETFRGQQERHVVPFDDELWADVTERLDCIADMAEELVTDMDSMVRYTTDPDRFIRDRIPWA